MRKVLLSLLALCVVPTVAMSQQADCPNCTMGIFETTDMLQNFGRFDGQTKEVFIGVQFDGIEVTGLRGVEFSVYGLDPFFFSYTPDAGANIVLGDIEAPLDREDTTGGGMNMAWPTCQVGTNGGFVFGKITMIALGGAGTVGDDFVLQIERKYPPSNLTQAFPLLNLCDDPTFTPTSLTASCYVINPTVGPGGIVGGCELIGVAVKDAPWSEIKALYR